IGWLIVQDLAMVLALVLLPPVAGLLGGTGEAAMTADTREIATALGITFAKVAAFVALMLLVGRQVIPRVLHYVAHTGSRELFPYWLSDPDLRQHSHAGLNKGEASSIIAPTIATSAATLTDM